MAKALWQNGQLPDEGRRQLASFYHPDGPTSLRSGLLPSSDMTSTGTPAATQTAVAGGSVLIPRFHAVIAGTRTAQQGAYPWSQTDAARTVDIATAVPPDVSPRNDLVCLRVVDAAVDALVETVGDLAVVRGTPAASPIDPALPVDGSYYPLWRVRVPAAAGYTAITTAMIDRLWQWTCLRGADLPVLSQAERDAIPPSQRYQGMRVWRMDAGRAEELVGTAWRSVSVPTWQTGTVAYGAIAVNASASAVITFPTAFTDASKVVVHLDTQYSRVSAACTARSTTSMTIIFSNFSNTASAAGVCRWTAYQVP